MKLRRIICAFMCLILLLSSAPFAIATEGTSITVETTFGGRKGEIFVPQHTLPRICYARLTGLSATEQSLFTTVVSLKDRHAYYNILGEDNEATSLHIELFYDSECRRGLSLSTTLPLESGPLPGVYITEAFFGAFPYYQEGYNKWTPTYRFQYFELYNYSDQPVDLKELQVIYSYRAVDYPLDWVFEKGNDGILRPGEIYMCGIYNGYSAHGGYADKETYAYDTEEHKAAFWKGFNEFYKVEVPLTNRVIVPCDNAPIPLSADSKGIAHTRLFNSSTGYLSLIKEGNTVNKISVYVKGSSYGFAHQFIPDDWDITLEQAVYTTGINPYKLLDAQRPDHQPTTVTATVPATKIVSYNLLANDDTVDGVTHYLTNRQPLFGRSIAQYDPDIFGLQEINGSWRDWIATNLPQYTCTKPTSIRNTNYDSMAPTEIWEIAMPIFYRTDKFELITKGDMFLCEDGSYQGPLWGDSSASQDTRNMVWAVLKNKTTGEIFNVINIHLGLYGKTVRTQRIKMLIEKGEALQATYGGGLIILGDFNIAEGNALFKPFDGHLSNAKYESLDYESFGTCTNFESTNKKYATAIDHIYVDDLYVEKYRVMDEMYEGGECPSDHYGVYIEVISEGYEDNDEPHVTGVQNGATYCTSATLTLSETHMDTATLDGTPITTGQYTVSTVGTHSLQVTDQAGRQLSLSFTVAGHQYVPSITPPSCSTAGYTTHTCSNCKSAYDDSFVPSKGHSYTHTVTPPSCTSGGYTTHTCSVCSHSYKDTYTNPSHTPGQWQTLSEPTYLKTGRQQRLCSKCGTLLNQRILPALEGSDVLTVFTDIKAKDWYCKNDSIYYVYNQGLFKGATATTFAPRQSMDRGMFVTVLGRLYGVDTSKLDPNTQFTDVPAKKYYAPYVKWAYENGIVKGMSDTAFAPLARITREQICAMLVRYCDYADITLGSIQSPLTFTDGGKISKYARAAVAACQQAGLVNGEKTAAGYRFRPADSASRAEVATIMLNFAKNYL